jgi:3-methyladenine DNA glycosylase AlkD
MTARSLTTVIAEVRRRIAEEADPKRAAGEQRYFKGTIRNRGVSVPKCQAIAREVFREHNRELSPTDWFDVAEQLLSSGWHEEGTVALDLISRLKPEPSGTLFERYERWLATYVGNWAHCDELCTHLIGSLLFATPALVKRLRPWTASENRWLRRGAAVSLVGPARRGLLLRESLAIARALLADTDDLVQKGYGWLLKEAARQHRPEVATFLERHVRRMPRTAFRYAIELFPPDERKRLMAL